ncbi:restriction endonuclease [Lysinibacillus mangiferihumi]|uniref:Restriction endonuclease n=1 Tax=Lysinibacillus mangiferihumi TaxID=1130819 RepID=A0A4U2YYJ2_9BACI|nr:restriction endonuclease [Lysinibacillus mangiferihumi]
MIVILIMVGSKPLFTILKRKQLEQNIARSGIRDIDLMDGFQFEAYLKVLFSRSGYHVTVTPKSGDYGADLVLTKGTKKIVVQAKRYGYGNRVSLGAVQEIYAARAYYGADEAWVVTNSEFTKQAGILGSACCVKLINRNALSQMILKINPSQTPREIYETVNPAPRECKKCGSPMFVRSVQKRERKFFGCSNYPKCTYTENINKD